MIQTLGMELTIAVNDMPKHTKAEMDLAAEEMGVMAVMFGQTLGYLSSGGIRLAGTSNPAS